MRAVVFATAGHIDHGKTSLVAALTGVDCDRLDEEKRRGITIVLGFAPLADPRGEMEVSFIDVPGHERLVHTMIAGAGAVDRALLVVAADEGVMPQTREHLDVLELLAISGGVVALTKADLVDAATLAARAAELRAVLAGGPFRDAPIVPCSSSTGTGIDAVREAVLAAAREVRRETETARPFRLAFDRVFTLTGAGTVVTGTVRWGRVADGDEVLLLPGERRLRVRGVQVHGGARGEAVAGERAALRLAGASVEELPRGDQLVGGGPWAASDRLALQVRLLPAAAQVREGDELWLHLLAGRRRARVERQHPHPLPAGQRGVLVVRLHRPLFACPGDRVVLRRVSPVATVGGGVVLDPFPTALRRRDAARLAALPDPRADLRGALEAWIAESGPAGVDQHRLAARLGLAPAALEAPLGALVAAGRHLVMRATPPAFVAAAAAQAIEQEARVALEAAGSVGLPMAELLARVLPPGPPRVREFYLDRLRAAGLLREVGGRAVAAALGPAADPLAAAVEGAYREARFDAPSPEETALRLGAKPKTVEGIVRFLIDGGRLVRIGGKWVLSRDLVDEVVASVRSWGVESFDVAQFKDRFGLTRKLAIPLLEWLDSSRVTRREGDRRRVLPVRR